MSEWLAVEAIVRQRDKEKAAHAIAKLSSESSETTKLKTVDVDVEIENDVFEENAFSDLSDPEVFDEESAQATTNATGNLTAGSAAVGERLNRANKSSTDSGNVPDEDGEVKANEEDADADDAKTPEPQCTHDAQTPPTELLIADAIADSNDQHEENDENIDSNKSSPSESSYETVANDFVDLAEPIASDYCDAQDTVASPTAKHAVIITDASVDIVNIRGDSPQKSGQDTGADTLSPLQEESNPQTSLDALQEPKSACVSPASSNGGIYSVSFVSYVCWNGYLCE